MGSEMCIRDRSNHHALTDTLLLEKLDGFPELPDAKPLQDLYLFRSFWLRLPLECCHHNSETPLFCSFDEGRRENSPTRNNTNGPLLRHGPIQSGQTLSAN